MSAGPPDEADLALVRAERAEARTEAAAEPTEEVADVADLDAGGVPARRYRPAGAVGTMLYLHGGGFVLGDLVTHDGFARRLANRTGWSVVVPDYRRAPEHAWPAADEDCAAAGDWLAAQGDEGPRVVVGDSAGAALALGETLRHPARYAAQVLVYPFVDPAGGSYDRELTGLDLPLERAAWFWDLYLQGQDSRGDDALHVLERDVTGLPRTLLQLAELDVLTPTGHLLAERLAGAGVTVTTEVYPAVQHGFWRHLDNDRAEPALADVARFLDALH
jgi:acetyl esterase